GRLLVLFLSAAAAAFAGDWEFDRLVKSVETHFQARRMHIPMMGLANFVLKVAHPAGTSGVKIAIFEDLQTTDDDLDALDQFMNQIDGERLHPMVRVHSRRGGEATYIYTGEVGKSTKVLVATFDRHEATIVEVKANIEALMKILGNPAGAGKM